MRDDLLVPGTPDQKIKSRYHFSSWIILILTLGWLLSATMPALAAVFEETGAPPDLETWKPWVIRGVEEQTCPTWYNDGQAFRCAWPARLTLTVEANSGKFSQDWLVLAPVWLPLPGGSGQWPIQVDLDGQPAPVVSKNGVPSIKVKPGQHQVTGTFEWNEMPETLPIPPASGLVTLTVAGRPVEFPVIDSTNRLWVQKRTIARAEEDRIEIRIQRLVTDGIPMQVLNLLKVNIAGRAREIKLDGFLLPGSVPMSLTCPMPARLSPEGELKIQARPGRHEIRIQTRFAGPVQTIELPASPYGQEVWSFQPQNHLRLVKIEGVPSIDPSQTDIPDSWKSHPTFLIDPGAKLTVKETRRGDPDPAPDRLTLHRTWWLDFNGHGFTVQDRINGTMSRQWFLALNAPGVLGRVAVDGRDQLITVQDSNKSGVELRRGQLNLVSDSRYKYDDQPVPAVGWDHDFQALSAELHLPPGWRLFTATGVDVLPGTWFERWTLLDFFLVLIIALAVFKLTSWRRGLLALVTLILIYHEHGAPRVVWVSLLAALALLRVLPDGWFKKVVNLWRLASVVVLVVLAIPFMVGQVRIGVYPQLEPLGRWDADLFPAGLVGGTAALKTEVPEPLVDEEATTGKEDKPAIPKEKERAEVQRKSMAPPPKPSPQAQSNLPQQLYARKQAVLTQDPNALIQTGPGLPAWQWRSINMKWNGPVDKDQQIRLWLLSPAINLVLAILRVIFLALMIVSLVDLKHWWQTMGPKAAVPAASAAALVVGLLISSLLSSPTMAAINEYPPNDLLQEYQKRLLAKPDCQPECAHYPRMNLTINPDSMTLILEAHAAVDTGVPLPGKAEAWWPREVWLNEKPAAGLSRSKDGWLWLHVPKGRHRITMSGPPSTGNSFQVPLPLRPDKVTVASEGWEVVGVRPDGQVEAALQFNRLKKDGREVGPSEVTVLPPFLQVERILFLGLTWEVETKVRRLTPTGSPVVVSVPLLAGESVNTPGLRVQQGQVLVNMDAKATEVTWTSSLDEAQDIQLKAPAGVPWTETWTLDASPIWHCNIKGIPVIHHKDGEGQWKPQWRPWPGENVTISVTKPKAIPGQTVTIDSALLDITPGERFHKAGLTLQVRASQGGQHRLLLPEEAKLQQVKIRDQSQPIGQSGREVVLPLSPGSQKIYVEWHQAMDSAVLLSGPEVKIGQQAVNAKVTIHMPPNRWLLLAGGPRLGPAVLFWSYLLMVVVVALALGRVSWTPLKTRHWLLLSLGLTQVHPLLGILIVGWLLALAWREKKGLPENWFVYNFGQIILIVWTVAALIGLYVAVERGLLGIPHMQVAGNQSNNFTLNWTQDRIEALMPQPWVLSLPRLVYRGLMLVWALWMALSLLKWLRWGWQAFGQNGWWRKAPRRTRNKPGPEPKKAEDSNENFQFESPAPPPLPPAKG